MDEAIAAAASEAVARYHETVQLSRSRLGEVQRAGADERENRAAWLTCMLITTSEEALRSKEALMHAREQRAQDQLHTAQLDLQEVEAVRERVASERESLRRQLHEVNSKMKRYVVESRQQQRFQKATRPAEQRAIRFQRKDDGLVGG